MTVQQLQQLAFNFGLETSVHNTSQTQIIRNIQLRCGGEPCFSTERRYGCTEKCEWSGECRTLKAHWRY